MCINTQSLCIDKTNHLSFPLWTCFTPGCVIKRAAILSPSELRKRNESIAARLSEAREFLHLTQSDFGAAIGASRDRVASYEDGRTPLRCDLALRACRHFFINEFWLAYGAVNEAALKLGKQSRFNNLETRLTMALAIEPIAIACPLGAEFVEWFDLHLREKYSDLLALQDGFPRVAVLASDGEEYADNAMLCMMGFWRRDVAQPFFPSFIATVIDRGIKLSRELEAEAAKKPPASERS